MKRTESRANRDKARDSRRDRLETHQSFVYQSIVDLCRSVPGQVEGQDKGQVTRKRVRKRKQRRNANRYANDNADGYANNIANDNAESKQINVAS
ncbi:hypothetical protein J8K86_19265 [Bacteroides fragilis]|uniref:hypothetical protein n=1 Tax=Bacteroides fragilis TaxID=817 RepID=UPI00202EB588|nr:hypothetical protein [Bacteroides fragilis]MCM0343916.1 hypothetical protein [Bacteroides fragilis]